MTDMADLEKRISVLEDIEAIKKVQAKYWRCNAEKLWDEIVDCFTEDAALEFGPNLQIKGADEIKNFYSSSMSSSADIIDIRVPQGHNPEIEIRSDGTANGKWLVYLYAISEQSRSRRSISAYYDNEYVKQGGQWKIKTCLLQTLLSETSTWGTGF